VLLPALAALAAVLVYGLVRVKDPAARFVMAALWLRFALSALHPYTHPPVAAGLSVNALSSCAVFALGLAVAKPRLWGRAALLPVYGVVLAALISAAVNRAYVDAFGVAVKWGYFAVVLVCAWQALERLGPRFIGGLTYAFATPLALQGLSLALGVSKRADEAGGRSFIGGYQHEAAFSIILLAALFVATQLSRWPAWGRAALTLLCAVGLYLAAYRTSLIAAAPLLGAYLVAEISQGFAPSARAAVKIAAAGLALAALAGGVWLLQDRLGDFLILAGDADVLRPPGDYRVLERELFSSRLYLWSQYLSVWSAGGFSVHAFGFGPDAWEGVFVTYAHNTLVSTLYELGAFGAAAVLALWAAMGAQALPALRRPGGAVLAAAHLSVILLNMATMGQWLIEGLILYALVCACTLQAAREERRLRRLVGQAGRRSLPPLKGPVGAPPRPLRPIGRARA